jgi:hypothetical protein
VGNLTVRSVVLQRALDRLGSLPALARVLGISSIDQIDRWRTGLEPTPDCVFLRTIDILEQRDAGARDNQGSPRL